METDKKIRTWNRDLVDRLIDLHSVALFKNSGELGIRQGLKALKATFQEADVNEDNIFNQVDYLAKCFVHLKHSLYDPATQSSEYQQILDVFDGLLSEFNISTHHSSPLQFLHLWSQYFRAKILMREGLFADALFKLTSSKNLTKNVENELLHYLNLAALACQVRLYSHADFADIRGTLEGPTDTLLTSIMYIFYIKNQAIFSEVELPHVRSLESIHPWLLRDYNWYFVMIRKFNKKEIANFTKEVLTEREYRSPKIFLQLKLFLLAIGQKELLAKVPKLDTIRRFDSDAVKNGSELNGLFDFLHRLENCQDDGMSKLEQFEKLFELIALPAKFESIIFEMWGYAALYSTSINLKIKSGSELFSRKYAESCLRFSRGTNSDLLSLLEGENVLKMGTLIYPQKEVAPVSAIKDATTERFGVLAKMMAELAVDRINGSIKKLFAPASKKHRIDMDTLEKNAEILVKALGELKGPYMKIGQLISTIIFNLPESVEAEISKILDSTIPLEGALVRKIVERELDANIDDIFEEWQDHPLASASIGQIHRARLKTGEEVIVKVQYPEIEKIVRNDAKTVFIVKPIYKSIFPSADLDIILEETNKKLLEECDYQMEMKYQNIARGLMSDFPDVYVPVVYEHLTTKKVIVMEYVQGEKFYDFKRTASDMEVNRACSIIIKFLLSSYLKHGLVNGDPHPGNFIFMPDGRVCVIDYGFSDIVGLDRRLIWLRTMAAAFENNLEDFTQALIDLGMVKDKEKFDFNAALNRARNLVTVGTESAVKINAEWVRNAIQSVTVRSVNRKYVNLNKAEIVASRFFLCMYSIILKMEPEIQLGKIYSDLLKEMTELYSLDYEMSKEA